MSRVDLLDRVRIVSPCTVPWASMTGDEGIRFCGKCRKNVYNLAAMSAADAGNLLQEAEGGTTCLRPARRADGNVVTGDCRARLRAAHARGLVAFAGVLAIVVVELCAQAFGLRTLREWFRTWHPGRTQAEVARTPDGPPRDKSRRLPILDDEQYVLGGAMVAEPGSATEAIAQMLDAPPAVAPRVSHPRLIPPRVAAALKTSGRDPLLPRPLRRSGEDYRYNAELCVSKEGRVESVTSIGSVDARLVAAVARKVKNWTYRPYAADGEPRPFCTFVSFLFKSEH